MEKVGLKRQMSGRKMTTEHNVENQLNWLTCIKKNQAYLGNMYKDSPRWIENTQFSKNYERLYINW